MTDIESALSLLRQCRNLDTPSKALDYLHERFTRYRLLSLYQCFFPIEFSESQASPYPAVEITEDCYTAKEWEFLALVNQKLFPLPYLDYYEEELNPCSLTSILITPVGLSWLDEEGLEHLTPGWQSLLPLTQTGRNYLEEYGLWAEQWYEDLFDSPTRLDDIASPASVNHKQLRHLCHQQGNPIRFFPLVLKLIDFTTFNLWLDETRSWTSSYYATTLLWSKSNVNYLTRKFQQAERLLNVSSDLINWLEADLNERFVDLLELWNTTSSTHNA